MHDPLRRHVRQTLRCTLCGQVISAGEPYWYMNGSSICERCLAAFARQELAPFRLVRGKEAER